MFDVHAEKKLDIARKNLRDLTRFYYEENLEQSGLALAKAMDVNIYDCAKDFIDSFEKAQTKKITETEHLKMFKYVAEEMAKSSLQVMPLPKSNTAIDIEINDICFYKDVRHLIEKICKDHEGKHDLRITIKDLRIHCTDSESEK